MQCYGIRHGHERVATRWVSSDPVNSFTGAEIKLAAVARLALKTGSFRNSVARVLLWKETVKVDKLTPNYESRIREHTQSFRNAKQQGQCHFSSDKSLISCS